MTRRTLYQIVLWSAAGALVAWNVPGCAPFEDLERTSGGLPRAARCGECHASVYEEWRASPHSRAFTSPEFLARTDGGSMDSCVTCHAPSPAPLELARPPAARLHAREEGVTCISCHRIAPEHGSPASPSMAGPLAIDALVQPHTIERLESWFRDAALCGRCHEDTYAEWTAASTNDTPTCQSCHMPAVVRKLTQATDVVSRVLVAFEEELELRSHDFSAVAALGETRAVLGKDFLTVRQSRSEGGLILRLRNDLPHSVPTGGFGRHRIAVTVSRGQEMIIERVLRSQGAALRSGEFLELRVPEEAARGRLRIDVVRRLSGAERTLDELAIWTRELEAGETPVAAGSSVVLNEAPAEESR